MRKLIVLSFLTLDGVMQSDDGPEVDPSGGFTYGGWSTPSRAPRYAPAKPRTFETRKPVIPHPRNSDTGKNG